MVQKILLAALGFALFAYAKPIAAQVIIPGAQPGRPGNINDALQQLQKAMEERNRVLIEALEAAQGGGRRINAGPLRWGGVQFAKVSADLQEKLGLPQNEGLVISSVEANSAGDKAGLKKNDVLLKINKKSVPGDPTAFDRFIQDRKADGPLELVVVRDGKEDAIKDARMPASMQGGGVRRGGAQLRPGVFVFPRIPFNPPPRILPPGGPRNFHMELTVNGVKTMRDQKGDQFSGEYSKDGLKITVQGKLENGQPRPSEIVVEEGKDTKKYSAVKDVPAKHQGALRQIMPNPLEPLMLLPAFPDFSGFPDFPPGILPVIPDPFK